MRVFEARRHIVVLRLCKSREHTTSSSSSIRRVKKNRKSERESHRLYVSKTCNTDAVSDATATILTWLCVCVCYVSALLSTGVQRLPDPLLCAQLLLVVSLACAFCSRFSLSSLSLLTPAPLPEQKKPSHFSLTSSHQLSPSVSCFVVILCVSLFSINGHLSLFSQCTVLLEYLYVVWFPTREYTFKLVSLSAAHCIVTQQIHILLPLTIQCCVFMIFFTSLFLSSIDSRQLGRCPGICISFPARLLETQHQ